MKTRSGHVEKLTQKCIMPILQGRGSIAVLQMREEHFGRRLLAEAPSRLVIQVAGELGEVTL